MATLLAAVVIALGIGVLWLVQLTCRAALRSEGPDPKFWRLLIALFAWSFVLGAVMRWARLST